ncbi:hypothetical protein EV182_004774 [Spiromyces aspiralis]|uniref:Uncharacterized protein n=1 Tax=Spiromyces aspiralis TaxID=68401 RepID=A0ACC1HRW7_9FUNG|nr:hypothetical protein EV182_004774 [Spiromyces aspiralis]
MSPTQSPTTATTATVAATTTTFSSPSTTVTSARGPTLGIDSSGALRPLCSCGCSCNQLLDTLIQAMDAQGVRKRVFDMVNPDVFSFQPSPSLDPNHGLGSPRPPPQYGQPTLRATAGPTTGSQASASPSSYFGGSSERQKMSTTTDTMTTSPQQSAFLNSGPCCGGGGLFPARCRSGGGKGECCGGGCSVCSPQNSGHRKDEPARPINDPQKPNIELDEDGYYMCGCGCRKPLAECGDCINDFCEEVMFNSPR